MSAPLPRTVIQLSSRWAESHDLLSIRTVIETPDDSYLGDDVSDPLPVELVPDRTEALNEILGKHTTPSPNPPSAQARRLHPVDQEMLSRFYECRVEVFRRLRDLDGKVRWQSLRHGNFAVLLKSMPEMFSKSIPLVDMFESVPVPYDDSSTFNPEEPASYSGSDNVAMQLWLSGKRVALVRAKQNTALGITQFLPFWKKGKSCAVSLVSAEGRLLFLIPYRNELPIAIGKPGSENNVECIETIDDTLRQNATLNPENGAEFIDRGRRLKFKTDNKVVIILEQGPATIRVDTATEFDPRPGVESGLMGVLYGED